MNNLFYKLILLAFLSSIYCSSKAQNVIMLKDRVYETIEYYTVPRLGEISQAKIIDGYIYTIEGWREDEYDKNYDWHYAKYDLNGNLIKRKKFPINITSYVYSSFDFMHQRHPNLQLFPLSNSEIVCFIPSVAPLPECYFFKFNTNLDSIKFLTKNIPAVSYHAPYRKIFKSADNKLLFLFTDSTSTQHLKVTLQKLDNNLNVLWSKDLMRDTLFNYSYLYSTSSVNKHEGLALNEKDGKYYIAIPKYNNGHNDWDSGYTEINIYRINSNGENLQVDSFNLFWDDPDTYDFIGTSCISITNLIFTNNGYRLTYYPFQGEGNYPHQSIEIDTTLRKTVHINDWPYKSDMFSAQYLSRGYIDIQSRPNHIVSEPILYNFSADYSIHILNQQSSQPIPDSFYVYYPNRFQKVSKYQTTWIEENIDTSYLLLGRISLVDSGTFLTIIPLSNTFGVYNGNIYKDNNKNCSFDASDTPYKNIAIEVTKTDNTTPFKYYDFTDNNGKFQIFTDTGNFSAKVLPNSNLWSSCPNTDNFSINNINDTITRNFFLKRTINCPKLSVSISPDRLRPCFSNNYSVNYCNRGTADATGAYVQVTFDSALTVNSASVPYSHIGNLYTFNIGTIKEDNCGQFTVNTTLSCNATTGIAHCVDAHIFPDSLCIPVNNNWSKANIAADGYCNGDTVHFRLRNIGTGNMTSSKKYYVVKDDALIVEPQDILLNAGQALNLKYPASGATMRLVAEQVDYFPYPSNPTAVVQNCNGIHPGFVNSFPHDDAADFIAVNCTESVGSYDPNDKNGLPEGINDQHHIANNTAIEYKIRFQNTGTDTAYDVYILDTLSSKLDVSSLQMGAASHSYVYEIYGEGKAILKISFPNIKLVDSLHNEPLSHGFVTYRIAQHTNNTNGDKIHNNAAIYFDYNQPVITNTTLHTVNTDFLRIITSIIENKWKATASAYPNPFRDRCTIEIKTDQIVNGNFRFTLFDLKGQLIQEQLFQDRVELYAKDLPNNMYLFRIEKDGELVGAGKVVKE